MISTKKAIKILCESDNKKREELINNLSEDDAKALLKHCLTVMLQDAKTDITEI